MALFIKSTAWKGFGTHHLVVVLTNEEPGAAMVDFKFKARGGASEAVTVKPSHGTLPPGATIAVELTLANQPGLSFEDVMPTLCSKSEAEPSWVLQRVPIPTRSAAPSPDAVDPTPAKHSRSPSAAADATRTVPLRGSSLLEAKQPALHSAAVAEPKMSHGRPPQSAVTERLLERWLEYKSLLDELAVYVSGGIRVKRLGATAATAPSARILTWVGGKDATAEGVIRTSKAGVAPFEWEVKVSSIARVVLGKPQPGATQKSIDARSVYFDVPRAGGLHVRCDSSDDFEALLALLASVPPLQSKIEWSNPTTLSTLPTDGLSATERSCASRIGLPTEKWANAKRLCIASEVGTAWTPLDFVERLHVSLFHGILLSSLVVSANPSSRDFIGLQAVVRC